MPAYVSPGESRGSNVLQILTNERPCRGQQAEEPRNTIAVPPTGVLKVCKDEFGSASGRKVDQRDQKDEEETDMEETGRSLNVRKYPDAKNVHQNGNQENHPVKHCSMPW